MATFSPAIWLFRTLAHWIGQRHACPISRLLAACGTCTCSAIAPYFPRIFYLIYSGLLLRPVQHPSPFINPPSLLYSVGAFREFSRTTGHSTLFSFPSFPDARSFNNFLALLTLHAFISIFPLRFCRCLRSSARALLRPVATARDQTRAEVMRRTSVSLPTKNVAHDPHEKRARHRPQEVGIFAGFQAVWMSQAQKTRWVKTAAIIFVVVALFYWLSPRGVDIYNEGTCAACSWSRVARHCWALVLTLI